ncbi:MAG TPA: hypothetical protein VIJ12_03620 [Candidatus Baltobacteraceae bacterium]
MFITKKKVRARGLFQRAIYALILGAMVASFEQPLLADIPPPQPFPVTHDLKAEGAIDIFADDSRFPNTEEKTHGGFYVTKNYCAIVLDILAEPGADANLSVEGAPNGRFNGPRFNEVPPIVIRNSGNQERAWTTVVALRHPYTAFLLVIPPNAATHGKIEIFGTALSCTAGTPGW